MDIKKISDIATVSTTSRQDKLLAITTAGKTGLAKVNEIVKDASVLTLRASVNNASASTDFYFDNGDHLGLYGMQALLLRVVYTTAGVTDASNFWKVRFVRMLPNTDNIILGVELRGTDTINQGQETYGASNIGDTTPLLAIKVQKIGNPPNVQQIAATVYIRRALT